MKFRVRLRTVVPGPALTGSTQMTVLPRTSSGGRGQALPGHQQQNLAVTGFQPG
ncbi:MAG TPA: hypothetical protein VFI65_19795 [Streptosporangiaceae bacterium]|nr:hypothetical protein [Streptosporangiaceae bacterium]